MHDTLLVFAVKWLQLIHCVRVRAVRNKHAGGKILKKAINVQDRIDVQGEIFSAKSIIVQGELKKHNTL